MTASIRNLLTEEELALLGEIAATSASLERTVGWHIAMTLNIRPKDFDGIIGPMNAYTRLDVLKKVVLPRLRSDKRKKEFSKLIEHLKDVVAKRNTVIHGEWRPSGKMNLWHYLATVDGRISATGVKAKNKKRVLRATELKTLAEALEDGVETLRELGFKTWLKRKYKEADMHRIVEND